MKCSDDRIITTHVGSLPRPPRIVQTMRAIEAGGAYNRSVFDADVRQAVADSVRGQSAIGLDVVNDGEMGKVSFINYVNERLSNFSPPDPKTVPAQWARTRETDNFPEFYQWFSALNAGIPAPRRLSLVCTGPISYVGQERLNADIANLKSALKGSAAVEAFMPSISPATIAGYHRNVHYATDGDFVMAIADAMHQEYKAIVDAGFVLQIDDPRLVTHYLRNPDLSLKDWTGWAETRVEALNRALRGIPQERVRHHTCYGINMGPRVYDLEMKYIVGLITKINAGGYSFEAANPRHEHEWRIWENANLPDDKVILPGLVTHSTYLVEHPELVAERIKRFASVVGRERVIASTDCGFASSATAEEMHPTIVDAKLKALVEGARIASSDLWG